MKGEVELFRATADTVGEGPLWDSGRGCLWWVDVDGRRIHRADPRTERTETFAIDARPGALALAADGTLVVAADLAWAVFDEATGGLRRIAGVPTRPETRFNDGVTDARGRFWTGTIEANRAPVGALFCLDGSRVRRAVEGLRTQNGCAIAPDGRTFYLADSHPDIRTIWAYDFDLEAGALSNRRVFHVSERGRPDGAAIDADGCYWYAAVEGGVVVQLDPAGRRMRAIELPVSRPTKPAFGGPDRSILYVTSMRANTDPAGEPLAGAVFAIDAGVRGHPEPAVVLETGNQEGGPNP